MKVKVKIYTLRLGEGSWIQEVVLLDIVEMAHFVRIAFHDLHGVIWLGLWGLKREERKSTEAVEFGLAFVGF